MKVITIFFKIDNSEKMKKIKIFKPEFVIKFKTKIKVIYRNKIYDLKNDSLPFEKNTNILKLKLLLLDNNLNFGEMLEQFDSPFEYIKNNEYILPKSFFSNLPKFKYKLEENDKSNYIKIFGNKFVANNKNRFIILYNNKIFPLKENFSKEYIDVKNIYRFEIFIIALYTDNNLSYMFHECSSLEEIMIENFEKNIKGYENNTTEISNKEKNELTIESTEFNQILETNEFTITLLNEEKTLYSTLTLSESNISKIKIVLILLISLLNIYLN